MDDKPKTHGGAREGAGRKPLKTPRKAITVRLFPRDIDKLKEICTVRGISQAAQITQWVNETRV